MNGLKILLCALLMLSQTTHAKMNYGFKSLSVNYLNWTERTESVSDWNTLHLGQKADFIYIEIEGGAGFDWGDIYGFIDMENPGKPVTSAPHHNRMATKGSLAYNLGETNLNLYAHIYTLNEKGFSDQNRVFGVSYDLNSDWGWWIKPFIGFHIQADVGSNGYMAGWVSSYSFKLKGLDFSISNWHEIEFSRDQANQGFTTTLDTNGDGLNDDYFPTNGRSHGQNGAISLWYHMNNKITWGLQYRYADRKLGTPYYQDALIYSLKSNF